MLKALKAIEAMRRAGRKPNAVLVYVGGQKQLAWWSYDDAAVSICVTDDDNLRGFDARPLVACDVTVIGSRDDRTKQIIARLAEHVRSITALTTTNSDDLGHVWMRGMGWRKIGG